MNNLTWTTLISTLVLILSVLFMTVSFIFNGLIELEYGKIFENIFASKFWRIVYAVAKILSFVSSIIYIHQVYNNNYFKLKSLKKILIIFATFIVSIETILSCYQIFSNRRFRYIDLLIMILILLTYVSFGLLFMGDIYAFYTKKHRIA